MQKTLNQKTKNLLNKKLATYNDYFPQIPLEEIFNTLAQNNITVLQEDQTIWQGFITGEKGRSCFDLACTDSKTGEYYTKINNCCLILTWYKMQSGNYEIVCYIS